MPTNDSPSGLFLDLRSCISSEDNSLNNQSSSRMYTRNSIPVLGLGFVLNRDQNNPHLSTSTLYDPDACQKYEIVALLTPPLTFQPEVGRVVRQSGSVCINL